MAKLDIQSLDDGQKARLVEARWSSSFTIWEIIEKVYKQNTAIYENRADWLQFIPEKRRRYTVQANRIFVNQEAVINSLIANPPGINVLPGREGQLAQEFARKLERFFRKKYDDLNIKETTRMSLRNLYFARLFITKAFWNTQTNDFDFRSLDPRKVRVSKFARKEIDSEFTIEEIEDNLCAVVERFPKQKEALLKKYGIADDKELYIKNPDVKYKEAWIQDYVIFKLDNIILDTIKNPYWDWDGILILPEEEIELNGDGTPENTGLDGQARRDKFQEIKLKQEERKGQVKQAADLEKAKVENPEAAPALPVEGDVAPAPEIPQFKTYYFNYFKYPRKPYIFATIFNNENTPIGRTDMITLSADLQKGIDKRKMDIDENCELANGIIKVDASVMSKADAQRIRFETKGIIWGKGVKDGVTRETGGALPEMVFNDMIDSRSEIDNIMAATSAFRGEREGQETKAGRLALIQQSFLRLNEMIQVVDFAAKEVFSWGMQLAKTRYTEYHEVQIEGDEGTREVIELIQDDFDTGSEVNIIAGKTLPVDDEFKFEQAQNDVEKGFISPVDYLEIAQYNNSKELAKNAVTYKINPVVSVGVTPEELATLQPPQNEEKPPNITINYADVQPDGQVQILQKIGIKVDPAITIAEKTAEQAKAHGEIALKKDAQQHGQMMAEKGQEMAQKEADKPAPSNTK